MKLNTDTATIHRGGVNTEQTFTIAAKGKAFEILSSGLYTDPMLAIVRELCCNARDSHIANGNPDEPFMVHLPNELEPFFEVTDYGLGLAEKDVFHIFTTYFESTKDDSDDFIGCLGLGSKSPFSYSDAFEVVSRYDGVRSIYSMFKNEEGVPSVAKMAEHPTMEPNGVSVKITIKRYDHSTFIRNLASALQYFETKPKVVGCPNFEFDPLPDDPIRGDDWFVSSREYSRTSIVCVQGGVGYKVAIDNISRGLTLTETRFIENMFLVLYFDIGQIDVPPSREEVRYDERTVANIHAAIRKAKRELSAKIEERLNEIDDTSLWDAYIKLNQYSTENFSSFRGMSEYVDSEAINNPMLAEYIRSNGTIRLELGTPMNKRSLQVGDGGLRHMALREYKPPRYGAYRVSRYTEITRGRFEVTPREKTLIVLFDEKTRAVMKLSQLNMNRRHSQILVIAPDNYKTFATDADAQREYNRLLGYLGNPPIIKISDVVLEDTSPQIAKPKEAKKLYWYKHVGSGRSSKAARSYYASNDILEWNRIATDNVDEAPTEGLYFLVQAHRHMLAGDTTDSNKVRWVSEFTSNIRHMLTMINKVKGTSYTEDDVWGAQTGLVTRTLKDDDNWTNIFTLADECMDYLKPYAILKSQLDNSRHHLDIERHWTKPEVASQYAKLSPKSNFRKMLQPLFDITEDDLAIMSMIPAARDVDRAVNGLNDPKFPTTSESMKPLYECNDLDYAYPMLSFVRHGSYADDTTRRYIFDYINLIDENTK